MKRERGRDREHRAELDQRCQAQLCFGPKPGGTFESETITAGLAPDGVYVYAEWGEGRRNRPLSQGEHGCPKQSRTLSGKPAQHRHKSHACCARMRRGSEILDCGVDFGECADRIETGAKRRGARTTVEITE